jgi:hypothetical protein
MGCNGLRNRAFTGSGWPVYGNRKNQTEGPIFAPNFVIRDWKIGKLVAIAAPSSTDTGSAVAKPITMNDIAIR